MGQPKKPLITDWNMLKYYSFPDPYSSERFRNFDEFKSKSSNHFLIAELGISGFDTYLFLRGFINAMIDLKLRDKRALNLLNNIFEIERKVIKESTKFNFDGVFFLDDWGTQKALMVSPELWIEIFKPLYKKHFDFVHSLGLKVFFHSCGNITSIVPELHETGVDALNISQPNVVDIDKISKILKGKQCFMIPISYQTVSIKGTVKDITREAEKLYKKLGDKKGGFIAHLEDYDVMGMSEENYQACWEVFRRIGV